MTRKLTLESAEGAAMTPKVKDQASSVQATANENKRVLERG